MITQAFDLNMIPSSAPVVVHVDQYDHGEGRFVISLYNGDTPYTPTGTAIIQGTKPDGKGFEYSATLSGNTVTANLTEQMTAVFGIVRAQIVITETSGRTGTFVFNLDVQKSALPADADMSHSEYQIVEELLEDVQQAAVDAAQSAEDADASAEDSEAWAVGTRDGVPVTSDDPTYHNNSKWWAEHGGGGGGSAHTIVNAKGQDMTNRAALKFTNMRVTDDATHNQTIVEIGSIITITTTESTLYGEDVTLSDGTTTLTETFDSSGRAVFYGVSLTGNLVISSSDGSETAIGSLTVPYFGIFEKDISFWSATIAVTTTTADFNGLTVYAKKNGITKGSAVFSSGSANITVPETGSYTLEVTQDWHTYASQAITVSDQTTYPASISGFKAPISLTTPTTEFRGQSISVSLDGTPITLSTPLAFDGSGDASFDALVAGTYVFTVTCQGEPYTATVVVTTETSYSGVIKMWTATIKVTASSQLYSQSVTVYKGSTSVGTVTLDATGKADILVHEAGTYYVKGVYDGWTYSTDAISVSAETDYSVSLEVFICTLSISTTSTELYSQTITVTKGGSTVGTTAFSAGSGGTATATFRVHETGTYTLTCTYGGEDYSESITIVAGDDGTTKPIAIETIPEGSSVTPTDNIQIWLNCAGIRDKTSYTTLSDVLADHDTLYRLMASDNAVDYLVRSTTWVSGITSDEYAMKYIGKWNYCSDTLLDDSTWSSSIINSSYWWYVINSNVPNMTSNTTPSGEASFKYGGLNANREAWKAFDGTFNHADADLAASNKTYETTDDYIKYEFAEPIKYARGRIWWDSAGAAYKTIMIDVSTDDSTYTEVYRANIAQAVKEYTFISSSAVDAKYIRCHMIGGRWGGGDERMLVDQLHFYVRQDVIGDFIDIYSAANDTVYYLDNGSPVTVCTTDENGHGTCSKSLLPNGTYTFYSTVAKDLPGGNLSTAYSKQVVVTDESVADGIYVMPDGYVAYWYGYGHLEASGLGNSNQASGTVTLTKNTNSVDCVLTASGFSQGGIYDLQTHDPSDYTKAVIFYPSLSVVGGYNSAQYMIGQEPSSGNQVANTAVVGGTAGTTVTNKKEEILMSNYSQTYFDVWGIGLCRTTDTVTCTVQAMWLE